MDDNQRQERVDRARKAELQKIELSVRDITAIETPVELNTRILNKLNRKLRNKSY